MNLLKKIKFLFGLHKFEVALKGKDGKDYLCDALEIGNELYIKTDDTTIVAVPDGTYDFEDGTVITVTEGLISEIVKPEEPEAEPASEEAAEDEPVAEPTEPDFDVEAEIAAIKDEIAKLKDALMLAVEHKETLEKKVVELSKEPETESITKTTEKEEKVKYNSTVSRLMNYKKNK